MSAPLSLQTLVKKTVASTSCLSIDEHILKYCDLWWHDAPLKLYMDRGRIQIKSGFLGEDIDLCVALIIAVKENNYNLIKLFTELGANINYSLLSINTKHVRDLCRQLGAKETLEDYDIFCIFNKIMHNKTSGSVILCHEIFINNPNLENKFAAQLRRLIYKRLCGLIEIKETDELSELLVKYWYAKAVQYDYKDAICFLDEKYTDLNEWRLKCYLYYNKIYELHDIYHKEKIQIDVNEMLSLACIRDNNPLTIYYCYALGGNINQAMLTSVQYYNIGNIYFCIDLGGNAFEEGSAIARQKGYNFLSHSLVLNIYSSDASLPLNLKDPEEISSLLKNYKSKNLSIILDYSHNIL
uniref:Protein MGF 360-13L n=1 Tax=African swine fever virus (isolate Tick/Malawi/Lil 20-1/1983) TaxID=10500 RepID=36013_ASFM2|nr:RecName: Full=Protein MGF 360-13L [African swine fever virus Malawi LIL 20/1]AAA50539.1 multigene family 360 protein [African swine fever virus]